MSACRLRRAPTTLHCRLGGPKATPRADRSKLARARRLVDRAREVLRLQGWIGEVQRTAHARDSADKRFDYYTPALAKRVCRLQARDFTNFGYPCWDGIKDTFRIL